MARQQYPQKRKVNVRRPRANSDTSRTRQEVNDHGSDFPKQRFPEADIMTDVMDVATKTLAL